jgi:hypothetical protein
VSERTRPRGIGLERTDQGVAQGSEDASMSVFRKAMVYLGLVDDDEYYGDDGDYYDDAGNGSGYEDAPERERPAASTSWSPAASTTRRRSATG